ncbi:hypothetical protein GCM10022221_29920 [Actinocorallia aurea]
MGTARRELLPHVGEELNTLEKIPRHHRARFHSVQPAARPVPPPGTPLSCREFGRAPGRRR